MIGTAFRTGVRLALNRGDKLPQVTKRFSSDGVWIYRKPVKIPSKNYLAQQVLLTSTWAWIFYHLFTEPEHLFGHYLQPDVTLWTDEELGVIAK